MTLLYTLPILVELDGKIRERGKCLVGERHVSIDHTTASTKCTNDL